MGKCQFSLIAHFGDIKNNLRANPFIGLFNKCHVSVSNKPYHALTWRNLYKLLNRTMSPRHLKNKFVTLFFRFTCNCLRPPCTRV